MADREKALAAKARGNKFFSAGQNEEAIKEYTEAISFDNTDHVFFSNRSACFANLGQYDKALEDGEQCVTLKPDWHKAYSRKGLALYNLKKFEEAKSCYEAGLKVAPDNADFKEQVGRCDKAMQSESNPLGALFGPDMWPKLMNNPTTRQWMDDEAFINKMKMLQSNPSLLGNFSSDPQLSQAISVILGMNISGAGGPGGMPGGPGGPGGDAPMDEGEDADEEIEVTAAGVKKMKKEEKKPEPEPEPEPELTEEEKKEIEDKKLALAEKTTGNEFFKKKDFATAMAHYKKAIELDPKTCTYKNNLAAAHFELAEYEKCIEVCKDAVTTAQQNRGSFKDVAKAHTRIGNSHLKCKRYEEAVEAYKNSLLEDHNDKVRRSLKRVEALIAKKAKEAYLDKDKSLEHKAAGNEFFKGGKWVDAIAEYTEALKRDPTNHAVYSNRAACYTKLMDWNKGMEDCDKCLSLEPTFVKAYIRKGKIQHFLKQYHKALETYEKGLALDPKCSELMEGRAMTMRAVNAASQSGEVDQQRVQESMKDPEIQAILRDPMVNSVLKQLQDNPAAGQRAMQDPTVRGKIEKLIAAGVLQVGS